MSTGQIGLIVLVVVGLVAIFVAFFLIRRYVWAELLGSKPEDKPSFTLDELRKMKDDGLITDTEYDSLRREMIEKIVTEKPADTEKINT